MSVNGNHDGMVDVLVIGAGMSGMAAASDLVRGGRRVVVVEKGRGVGGRMATRRIGVAVLDHGAQFVTARSERFQEQMGAWESHGAAEEWCRGFAAEADGHPRWRGNPGMNALPKSFAEGVEVRLGSRVESIARDDGHWVVTLADGGTMTSTAIMLTAPVPQALALMDAGGVAIEGDVRSGLEQIEYERCLAVLAVLDGPSGMRPPGAMAFDEGPIAWLADNQMKGISPVPAVTIHASHAFSLENWDADCDDVARRVLQAASVWIRAGVKEYQVHGWLYGKPMRAHDDVCVVAHAWPPLVMAGDAFAGPKVEGAACSGWAAAKYLLEIDFTSS